MRYECFMCEAAKELNGKEGWEMQHLHFDDEEVEVLTCNICKQKSPMEFMEKLISQRAEQSATEES